MKLPRKTIADLLILLQMYRHNLIEKELILLTIGFIWQKVATLVCTNF